MDASFFLFFLLVFLAGAFSGGILVWSLSRKHYRMNLLTQNTAYEEKITQLTTETREFLQKIARLEAEKEGMAHSLKTQLETTQHLEETFQAHFDALANRIFEEKAHVFKQHNEQGLTLLLHPLKEKLMAFEKKVEDVFLHHSKEQFSLKNEIQRIVLANERITLQTENLTQALKGDHKLQGHWGEILLEKILEDSGLRKGEDYVLQATTLRLKAQDGTAQKPDVIVKLPEDKHIIIDAKVSLTAYERACSEPDGEIKRRHMKDFFISLKAHITGLEQRRYQENPGLNTPDFVIMFLPIEGAYTLALQNDPSLHSYAWDKKIVLVGPSTLFATLKTVASLWRIEMQNRNTLEIARQGAALYDKIANFTHDMIALGDKLSGAQKTYTEAFKKLSTGHGNILKRTEAFKALGLKTSKKIPPFLSCDDDLSPSPLASIPPEE